MKIELLLDYIKPKTPTYKSLRNEILHINNGDKSFIWIHGGVLDITVCDFFDLFPLNSFRTGHLGSWEEIINGRACALDHNGTVCKKFAATPVISDTLQTENEDMTTGDTVYLPGSIVSKNGIEKLTLYTKNDRKYCEVDRAKSYFVPFVKANYNGEFLPITDIHKNPKNNFDNTVFVSTMFAEHKNLIIKILRDIFHGLKNEKVEFSISDVIDRVVYLDGRIERISAKIDNRRIIIGKLEYNNEIDLINDLFIPFIAAIEHDKVVSELGKNKTVFPFLSLSFTLILRYVISSLNSTKGQINIYLEWGAFNSAGHSLFSSGYYRKKAGLIGKIYNYISKKSIKIPPMFLVLLPSSTMNLLPCTVYGSDTHILDELFNNILNIDNRELAPVVQQNNIVKEAIKWHGKWAKQMSLYFNNRFAKKRCISHGARYHEYSEPIMTETFKKLTIRQSLMLTGALYEAYCNKEQ